MGNKEYYLQDMIKWLIDHFQRQGYEVIKYNPKFRPARVPLHCIKEDGDKTDEIVIEVTTNNIITEDSFLPSKVFSGVRINEASSLRFYQYYFIKAKTYLAYPDYVVENDKFKEFKKKCEDKDIGLGLLRTSENKIEEILKPRSIFDTACEELGITKHLKKINKLEYHLRNCLYYFVYYPKPIFYQRSIASRPLKEKKYQISLRIIDKLSEINNVIYKEEINDLYNDYRYESNDYEIAKKFTEKLWNKYFSIEYPDISKRIEDILQRDDKYREHFLHQFQVFLIGTCILDKFYPEISKKFYEKYECEIEKVWLATSTFHDFSYGLQNFDEWLMKFFEDMLKIKHSLTKEKLTFLNLDAAMIREALYDNIIKIVNHLKSDLTSEQKKKLTHFFYEKAVTDRNHGVLSAISLLQLYYNDENRTINENGILQAAVGIIMHDEDIWESLCGCQGYRRRDYALPKDSKTCKEYCNRPLWSQKENRIYNEKKDGDAKCETWEEAIMRLRLVEKIKFEENPISFLLIYCDTIHDEGRVTSSDKLVSKDRSSLKDIDIEEIGGKINISINLESEHREKKEQEIERLTWCLQDDRFNVKINGEIQKINGSGGR